MTMTATATAGVGDIFTCSHNVLHPPSKNLCYLRAVECHFMRQLTLILDILELNFIFAEVVITLSAYESIIECVISTSHIFIVDVKFQTIIIRNYSCHRHE